MGLNMDKKINEQFDKISSGTKANFTRNYNKQHQAITKKAKGKKVKEESGSDSEGDILLDEEELKEIKKAKQIEKAQKKAENAMKRIDKLTKITKTEGGGKEKLKKKRGQSKAKKGPAKKKGKKKKGEESEEDEMDSDDSLNLFIVDDDEEF